MPKRGKKRPTMKIVRTYNRDGYIVDESEFIRIAHSDVYIGYRNEKDGEDQFERVVILLSGEGINGEIDSMMLPYPEQAKKLSEFFATIAKMYE